MVIRHSWQRLLGESRYREQFPFTPLSLPLHKQHQFCSTLLYLETSSRVVVYFHQGAPVPRLSGYYRLWDWHQRRIPTRATPAQHNPAWLLHAGDCHSLCLHLLWLLTTHNAKFRELGETFDTCKSISLSGIMMQWGHMSYEPSTEPPIIKNQNKSNKKKKNSITPLENSWPVYSSLITEKCNLQIEKWSCLFSRQQWMRHWPVRSRISEQAACRCRQLM